MSLQIKKASVSDVKILAGLFNSYRMFYNQLSDIEAAEIFLEQRIVKDESAIFIAFFNDQPAGFTQLYPIFSSVSLSKAWLLNDMFVAEGYRKNGIASALLNTAKEYGASTAAKWLMLQTSADNFDAQSVYEKNGWIKEKDFFYTINCY